MAARAGADTFVAGNAVFGQPDPAAAVVAIRLAAEAAGQISYDAAIQRPSCCA